MTPCQGSCRAVGPIRRTTSSVSPRPVRHNSGLVKAKVAELRQAMTRGIAPEEYQTTIDVLATMAANLESVGRSS